MNRIPIYQHYCKLQPFVDVFKIVKINEWTYCHKEGDISENIWDDKLAKNYWRIQGITSSSNYIQIPASKHLPKKALGLTSKFIYLMIKIEHCRQAVIHLDFIVDETRLTRVSLSTIYKTFKN